jgi:hypothetical protein
MDKLIHTTRYNHVGAMVMMDYWQGMSREGGAVTVDRSAVVAMTLILAVHIQNRRTFF